jgi:hypothetical protein
VDNKSSCIILHRLKKIKENLLLTQAMSIEKTKEKIYSPSKKLSSKQVTIGQ